MTITNQTNPVGSQYISKKSQIIVPKDGITGLESSTKERIYTSLRLTKTGNNPSVYSKEIVQHPNAKSDSYTVIAKQNKDTGEFDFNLGADYKNTDKDAFRKLLVDQTKTQSKDAEKQIRDKINADTKAINGNESSTDTTEDSKNSTKTKENPMAGTGRKNYGVMVYPSFIQKSNQDKLKVTILEFSSRFAGGKPTEGQKKRLIDSNKPKRSDYGTNRNERSNYLAALRKYNANKGTKESIKQNNGALSLDNNKRIEANKRTLGHITLPIPNGVSDQNRVDFTDGTMNVFQAGAAETALDTLMKGFSKGAETGADFVADFLTNPGTGAALANLITSSVLGLDNNELLARTSGSIFNNNLELLFKGPTLRPFTFQFQLSPRDGGEARQVQKIIRAFKQSSAIQKTVGGMFLAAPNTYKLEFINGNTGRTHEFLPRIKECACTGVNVNYMPTNSYMTYEDSSMVAYTLQIGFKELIPVFNEDYDDNDQEQTGMISMPNNPNTGGNIGF